MQGHYHFDGEEYCESCLPVSEDHPEVGLDTGEQDTPAQCFLCRRPLSYSLTTHGVDYVIAHIIEALEDGDYDDTSACYSLPDNPDYYYEGEPAWSVVYDWAKDLSCYHLDPKDRCLVGIFIELCDETRKRMLEVP